MPLATIDAAVDGGVDAVHLRDREASARALYKRGEELQSRLAGRAALIINDRIDVALALGADGVQLGVASLGVEVARRIWPEGRFGVSAHSPTEAAEAERLGADWVVLGTIYPSSSHPGGRALGPSAIPRDLRVPVIAIGGIDQSNIHEALAAGAHGIAVISAVLSAPDARTAAKALSR